MPENVTNVSERKGSRKRVLLLVYLICQNKFLTGGHKNQFRILGKHSTHNKKELLEEFLEWLTWLTTLPFQKVSWLIWTWLTVFRKITLSVRILLGCFLQVSSWPDLLSIHSSFFCTFFKVKLTLEGENFHSFFSNSRKTSDLITFIHRTYYIE